jgi:hypothetical protein
MGNKETFISTSKFPNDMRIKVGPKYPNKTMDDIRHITFSCSESIHLYKKEGGYNPAYPYKPHNSMEEAMTHLTNRGVTDIKIVKHYDETI